MDLTVRYRYDELEKKYFTEGEDLDLIVKFFGRFVPVQSRAEYFNYKTI